MKPVLVLSLCGLLFASCKHKTSFDSLGEVSYSRDIAPIINSNCAFSGCHGDEKHRKFNLTTYEGLMSGGIEAGSPDKSELYHSLISYSDENRMPQKPYDPLSGKQVQLIYVWIGQGAKNN